VTKIKHAKNVDKNVTHANN